MLKFVKMPNIQTLRALVNERLTAAAEEIFALFERTIAEYEGELCRSHKENQRQRRLLDELTPRGPSPCAGAGVRVPSPSPGPGLNHEIIPTGAIGEEQNVKQEEEQLPVSVPEFIAVCVKTEESPLLQSQRVHREETQEDVVPEPHVHTETHQGRTEFTSGTNYDWEPPFSCPAALMETEADGDHYNQVQFRDGGTAQNSGLSSESQPGTSATVNAQDVSATNEGDKNNQCPVCKNKFWSKFSLQKHFKVHTEDRPFCCSICPKTFIHKGDLDKHHRIHTGEKPYCCPFCEKTFTQKGNLDKHTRVHTGERPYSCLLCDKTFSVACTLQGHMRTHTGEKPYSCSLCNKGFSQGSALRAHMSTHTGDKPFSCPICNKGFKQRSYLRVHMRNHKDKPELNQSN